MNIEQNHKPGRNGKALILSAAVSVLSGLVFASSAHAQNDEAAICASRDGPLLSGGRLLCATAPTRTCLEPAFRAGAMVCLKYEDGGNSEQVVSKNASPRAKGEWAAEAERAAKRHGVPVPLFHALVHHESRWNANAVSPIGIAIALRNVSIHAPGLGSIRRSAGT